MKLTVAIVSSILFFTISPCPAQINCTLAPFKPINSIPNPSFEITQPCANSDAFAYLQYPVPGWFASDSDYTYYYHACTNFILTDHNPSLFPPGLPITPALYQFFHFFPKVPQPVPDGNGVIAISDWPAGTKKFGDSTYVDPKTYIYSRLIRKFKKDSLYKLNFSVGFGKASTGTAPKTYYPTYSNYFISPPPESFTLYGSTDSNHIAPPPLKGTPFCPLTWSQNWIVLGTCTVNGDSGTWVKTAITFSPSQDIQAIAIGPPCERRFPVANDVISGQYHYFLDDLQLSMAAVPLPVVDLAAGSFCSGASASATLGMRFADFYKGSSFQWFKNGQPLTGENNATLITTPATYGEGFYQCRVQNDSVCLGTDSFQVNWQPRPPEYIGNGRADTTLCIGDTLHLTASTDSTFRIRWSDGSILPVKTITQPGTYSVTLSNTCDTVTATKNVLFRNCPSDFFVPSAFTPNYDGLNDVFRARYRKKPVYFRLGIYNRYGQRLFYSDNPDKGWNGELKSMQQPQGVYVWQIDYTANDGSTHHLSGTVTLIR